MQLIMKSLGWQRLPGIAVLVFSCFVGHSVAQGSRSSVQLSPGDLDFSSQVVGTASSPQIEAIIVQISNATGVTFNSIGLSGKDVADFTVQSDTCSGANFTSGSCQIAIVFQPT